MRTRCLGVTLGLLVVLTTGVACGRTNHVGTSPSAQHSIDGLEQCLAETLRKQLSNRGIDPDRCVSLPVSGEANCVMDIALAQDDNDRYIITWHYRNAGDYDQNGKVEIADVTQLAIHYGESVDEEENTLAAVIDGDGSDKVDIGDITPIAMNYGAEVLGYRVETAEAPGGTFDELDRVYLEDMQSDEGRLRAEYLLSNLNHPVVRVVPFDSEEEPGILSVEFIAQLDCPSVLSVRPLTCEVNRAVIYQADVSGEGQREYFWQFSENAIPGTSDAELPTVVMTETGGNDCSLTVTTPFGTDTFEFTVTVVAAGAEPYITKVEPQSGLADTETTFAATVGGAEPITYAWDFGGGATPPTSSEAIPEMLLGQAGDYPVTLIIENAFGDDLYQFTLHVVEGMNLQVLAMLIRLEGTENTLYGDPLFETDFFTPPTGGGLCQGEAIAGCNAYGYLDALQYLHIPEEKVYGFDQEPPSGQVGAYEGTLAYISTQLDWEITCPGHVAEELFLHDPFETAGHLKGCFGAIEDVYTVVARVQEGTLGVPAEAIEVVIEMDVTNTS